MTNLTIPHKFKPRPYQLPILQSLDKGTKRAVIVYNRRCLLGGTPIAMSNGRYKAIEDIKEDDLILSYDGENLVNKRVVSIYKNGEQEVFNYNGLYSTSNHKVLSRGKWVEIDKAEYLTNVGKLSFGNVYKNRKNFWSEKKNKTDSKFGETYDLNVEDNHNYIANGYIVHNSGKDKTCFNFIIKKAVERVGTYFYFLPSYTQAKKVIWDNIDSDGLRMLDHIPKEIIKNTNATELKIELINGSIIQLIAADEFAKSGVGTNPIGVVFSEFSITHPDAWKYVSPILAVNGGWAIFNFTPRGKNHAWELLERAKRDEEKE